MPLNGDTQVQNVLKAVLEIFNKLQRKTDIIYKLLCTRMYVCMYVHVLVCLHLVTTMWFFDKIYNVAEIDIFK